MSDLSKPEGHAYGRRPQHSDKLLTEVGPGTPLGELMRRYWHPVAVAREVTDLPRKVRILGEDLIGALSGPSVRAGSGGSSTPGAPAVVFEQEQALVTVRSGNFYEQRAAVG